MSDQQDVTGHPQGGLDKAPEGDSPPGTYGEGETVSQPSGEGGENASRAATGGPMTSDAAAPEAPGQEGVDQQVGGPSSEDPRNVNAPGGSAGNRAGRDPEQ
jgi:hypothetical protein